jgi:alpha-mannosidase
LGDRAQLEGRTLVDYKRIGLDTIWYDGFEEGPVWNTIRFKGEQQTFFSPNGFEVEIRLFHTAKRIDLTYEIVKKPIIAPEGIYLAFPFQLEGGKVYCEVPGGLMEAGVDQLPGSSNDWNTIQNFASVKNEAAQIVFGSHEVPLVQFGGINTGRFLAGATPQSAHIFSWPMNNYWTTNFNADQRGGHEWSYYITSSADASNRFATQFGWGARVPMPARVLPPGTKKDEIYTGSFLQGIPDNVLLVSARPDEDGESIILHLRELDGRPARLNISGPDGKALSLIRVNVVGKPVRESGDPDAIGPLESGFFKVF